MNWNDQRDVGMQIVDQLQWAAVYMLQADSMKFVATEGQVKGFDLTPPPVVRAVAFVSGKLLQWDHQAWL